MNVLLGLIARQPPTDRVSDVRSSARPSSDDPTSSLWKSVDVRKAHELSDVESLEPGAPIAALNVALADEGAGLRLQAVTALINVGTDQAAKALRAEASRRRNADSPDEYDARSITT